MSSFSNDAKETTQVGCLLWILFGMIGLMLIGFTVFQTGLYYTMMPWLRQQETAINRSSQGYVDAKQAQLLKYTQDAYRLTAEIESARARGENTAYSSAQLKVSLDTIEREAATLPDPSYVPAQTRTLMAQHGRGI